MKKTTTIFTIAVTLLTLTITSQPAMSRNTDHILPGVVLGATVGALIASQISSHPTQRYMPSHQQVYARPVVIVPPPVFRSRPVVYVSEPRHYRKHQRHHRSHRKQNRGRARW